MTGDMLIIVRSFLGTAAVATAIVAWYQARRRSREREIERQEESALHDGRVDALEHAVERLAAQIEQLASGQEFLNRVVANQAARLPNPIPEPPRLVTPH